MCVCVVHTRPYADLHLCCHASICAGNSLLRRLLLSDCNNLSALPESLTEAAALQELELSGLCNKFDRLPNLGAFTALTKLTIKECSKLRLWPDNLTALVMRNQLKQLSLASSPFVVNGTACEAVVQRLKHFEVFIRSPLEQECEPKSQSGADMRAWIDGQSQQHAVLELMQPPAPAAGFAAPAFSPIRAPVSNPFGDAKPVDASPERYFAIKQRMQSASGSNSPTWFGAGSPMKSGTPAGYPSPNRNWSRLQYNTDFLVEAEYAAASSTAGREPPEAATDAEASGVLLALTDRSTGCYLPMRPLNNGKGQETTQFTGDTTAAAGSSSAAVTAGLRSQPSTPSRRNPFGDAKPVDASPEKYFANRIHGTLHGHDGSFAEPCADTSAAILEALETFNIRSSNSAVGSSNWGSYEGSCNNSAGPSARTSSSVETAADQVSAALKINGNDSAEASNSCSSAGPSVRTSSSSG